MKVQLIHTSDCHVWKEALTVLEEALRENDIQEKVEVVLVQTQDEANTYKFLGSPTILIDGIDVDKMAKHLTNYTLSSCRSYIYNKKFYEYPPKEMLIDALGKPSSV